MIRVQACVWSAVLDYEHMSGLQAADTVKQQAVQLASSKSQAASALAAQKAAEQVSPYAGMVVCSVESYEVLYLHRWAL